ncbi:ribonuclease H-like domain-containing protein [Tanacetum coccineum]
MMIRTWAFINQLPVQAVRCTNTINTVNTGVSTGNSKVNTASTETSTASFSDATVYAFLSTQPQGSQLVHEDLEQIHDDDLEEIDLKWNMALLSMRARKFYQEELEGDLHVDGGGLIGVLGRGIEKSANMASHGITDSEIALLKRSVGHKDYLWDLVDELEKISVNDKSKRRFWYTVFPSPIPNLNDQPPLDLSYSGLEEFKQKPECRRTQKVEEKYDAPIIEDWVSDDEEEVESIPKVEKKTDVPTATKKESVKTVKPSRRSVRYAEMYRSQRPRGNQRSWNGQKSAQLGCNFVFNNKACFICGNFDHFQYNCPNAYKHMVPRAVLMKTGLKTVKNAKPLSTVRSVNTVRPFSTAKFVNTVRPYNTAHPKPTVSCARPKTHFQNQAQRPFYKNTALTKRSNIQNINTGKQIVNTVRPNVNTVRARGFNAVKPSACWVWRPIKSLCASLTFNKYNYIDARGRSKSWMLKALSGTCSNLSVSKNLMGGHVSFGGDANGESFNGKLPDESQILLKIPRQNNMYSFDMKNIVPKDGLTCLVAKATSEESMLWHRRLGHAEAVSTACYVQNRVLVVKPHNKTPYELFRGIKPAIGFMKPFGCHVTILNTLDKLGKFDGKSDEGFFVGYSLSSKAFRVYNIRTRKVQENLHVGFLENKPMLEGNGPKWLFDLDSLTQSMNYVPVVAGTFSNVSAGIQGGSESSISSQQDQDCIVMPIWKDASYFDDASLKSIADVQIQDQDGTHDDCSFQDNGIDDHQVNTASPQVNTGSREISTAAPEVNTATPEGLMGPIPTTKDTQVEDQDIELGNISPSYEVSSTPHTRIHKDHPIDHVIGDVQSSVQTRRMTTSYYEPGFVGAIYEGKTHQDLRTCLFACFLSQEEPKRVSKALSDPAWVEAMQEELLQFKLQNVWVLVDLPKGHRAIGTKHRRALEFQPGEHVFLKVSPTRGVRRFGIKGKLSPRFIGPFEILDRVGEVSYRLALPPQLSHVHNVFHVSLLRGYKYHPLHVISYPFDQIREDLSYTEEPESILDRQDRVMRNKTIPFVKILWRNHPEREATWETEESIRTSYPHFLP